MALLESIGDPTRPWAWRSSRSATGSAAVNSTRSCGGRRRSSTWPPVIPSRAPATAWDHRWRSRWHGAARSVVAGPSRMAPRPARRCRNGPTQQHRNLLRCCQLGLRPRDHFGALRADDSVVRACEDALQTAHRASNDRAVGLAGYALAIGLLNQDAAADRHRGLELMMQPATLAAQACPLPYPGHRRVHRPGEGQARRPRYCHWGDAPSRRRAASGRTPLLWRLGYRRSGGDTAGAWRPGRPGRSPRGVRPVGEPWADDGSAMLEITLLRLRALLSRARGDDIAYRDLGSLSRHGGIAWLRRTHRDGQGHEVRLASTLRRMASEYWPSSIGFRSRRDPLRKRCLAADRCLGERLASRARS